MRLRLVLGQGGKPAHRHRRGPGLVDFSLFPHLDHPALPENIMADAERWAAALSKPAYAIGRGASDGYPSRARAWSSNSAA